MCVVLHTGVPGLMWYGGDRDCFCRIQGMPVGEAERAQAAVGKHSLDVGELQGMPVPGHGAFWQ